MPTQKFRKGEPRPVNAGRRKGTPNKFTSIKQSFLDAFKDERVGGTEGLVLWVKKNERNRAMFYGWITKMLPSSITGGEDDKGKPLPIRLIIENGNTNTNNRRGEGS